MSEIVAAIQKFGQVEHSRLIRGIYSARQPAYDPRAKLDICGINSAMNIEAYMDSLLEDRKLSRRELASRVGMDEGTIRKAAKNNFAAMSAGNLYKIAKELGLSMEILLAQGSLNHPDSQSPLELPIRFVTGGGAWVESDHYVQIEPKTYPAILDPRVPIVDQWYEELRGDSVDRIIPEFALMHVVSAARAEFKHGDVVIMERTRQGGALVERSAKQVSFTSRGPEFWPRSNNPIWDKPIRLNDHEDDETVSVRIVGIVRNAILRLDR